MDQRYVVMVSLILLILSFSVVPARAYDISDPGFTNEIIKEIDTPQIKPGDDGSIAITLKNPYPDEMKNITFTAEIYHYSSLDVEKNISYVDEPPVFDNNEINSVKEISDLSTNATEELEYQIDTTEKTEEGVYSLRFGLEFWMDGEKENVSRFLLESTFEVKEPLSRWPQYVLGTVSGAAGVLAVIIYMQEKYGYFPKLEKALDDWSSKLEEFRSRLK